MLIEEMKCMSSHEMIGTNEMNKPTGIEQTHSNSQIEQWLPHMWLTDHKWSKAHYRVPSGKVLVLNAIY